MVIMLKNSFVFLLPGRSQRGDSCNLFQMGNLLRSQLPPVAALEACQANPALRHALEPDDLHANLLAHAPDLTVFSFGQRHLQNGLFGLPLEQP